MPIKELEKNITLLRDINEIYVLQLIKEQGPISRAEVSRRYNISRAAVSDIVNRLLQKEFIIEIGEGVSSGKGGRKPVLLAFNKKARYIIGIELKKTYYRVALCDLDANILVLRQRKIVNSVSGQTLVHHVQKLIDKVLKEKKICIDKIIGIGIGIPGLVDFELGVLKEAHSELPWNKLPLKSLFEKVYGANVYVDNDIKMAAIGEYVFGQRRRINNMIFIGVGEGLGAGFIINGQIYRGITCSAGEIGYDELGYFFQEKGKFPLLFHGQKYFGDILSYYNLFNSIKLAIQNGHTSLLEKKVIQNGKELRATDILDAALAGDILCNKILKEYAHLLGILCMNLINYLNPELVVFNGEIIEKNSLILNLIKQRVHRDILHLPLSKVKILSSTTKRNSGMKGAVGLVLQDFFEPPLIDTRKYRTTSAVP